MPLLELQASKLPTTTTTTSSSTTLPSPPSPQPDMTCSALTTC